MMLDGPGEYFPCVIAVNRIGAERHIEFSADTPTQIDPEPGVRAFARLVVIDFELLALAGQNPLLRLAAHHTSLSHT